MFAGCTGLRTIDITTFNTGNLTNTSSMFSGCTGLTTIDLSNFNTSKVTNMNSMFRDCTGLTTLDVSEFDTSNVTNMSIMFYSCTSLTNLDLSNKFIIKDGITTSDMFTKITNITIKAKQDTVNKIKSLFPQFTDSNFEIVS